MIKNILAVGDSFTFGEELPNREIQRYSSLLANQVGALVTNMAKPGSGNKRMVRYVIEHIAQGNPVDLVIVGWSSAGRMEFADEDGFFDVWPGYNGPMFKKDGQVWRGQLLEYLNRHHNTEYLYRQFLLDVILLQNYLKMHNIKYLMLNTVINEFYHNQHHDDQQDLLSQIDLTDFVGWPSTGMCEWTYGSPVGPNGHFLEQGHQIVATKLYEHIRNREWI